MSSHSPQDDLQSSNPSQASRSSSEDVSGGASGLAAEAGAASPNSAKAPAKKPQLWILNPWADMLLFVATPLMIIPTLFAARSRFSVEEIYLFVAAFGATGHHLPGMMRAYGDKALFNRFRIRFIVSPILLLIVCIGFAMQNLEGLIVLLLLWGFWHGFMQVYGFLRIYDAKVGSFSPVTARIDWLMCLSWFGLGLLWSPGRMEQIFREMYKANLPIINPDLFHGFQVGWAAFTLFVITPMFAFNYVINRRRGTSPSVIKLVAMGTSFGFWWFCMVNIKHTLLGIALFEVFHDVQYLAIVWIFNRKRADSDPNVGPFTRFLFRRNLALVGVYLTMIAGYGFVVGMLPSMAIARETYIASVYGLMAASTFLHFYFDGFIWKVRENSTRESLGLKTGKSSVDRKIDLRTEFMHGAKWAAFLIPVAILWNSEKQEKEMGLDHYRNLVELAPGSWRAWTELGAEFTRQAQANAQTSEASLKNAVTAYTMAVDINDDLPDAYIELGLAHRFLQEYDEARAAFENALERNPNLAIAHNELGKLSFQDAVDSFRNAVRLQSQARLDDAKMRFEAAFKSFKKAAELSPEDAGAWVALGDAYRRHAEQSANEVADFQSQFPNVSDLNAAIECYEKALAIDENFVEALRGRGVTYHRQQETGKAIQDYSRAIELRPGQAALYVDRAIFYRSMEKFEEAIADFDRATEFLEVAAYAHVELANIYWLGPESIRDLDRAEIHALAASSLSSDNAPKLWKLVADIRVEAQEFDLAIEAYWKAHEVASEPYRPQLLQWIRQVEQLQQQRAEGSPNPPSPLLPSGTGDNSNN